MNITRCIIWRYCKSFFTTTSIIKTFNIRMSTFVVKEWILFKQIIVFHFWISISTIANFTKPICYWFFIFCDTIVSIIVVFILLFFFAGNVPIFFLLLAVTFWLFNFRERATAFLLVHTPPSIAWRWSRIHCALNNPIKWRSFDTRTITFSPMLSIVIYLQQKLEMCFSPFQKMVLSYSP